MDLGLTDVQDELVASFRQLLAKGSSSEQVRDAQPLGFDVELWATLLETGAVQMAVPEDRGGWGATLVDLALVAEELGRASASAPVIESQLAARLLASVASDDAAQMLDRVLAGDALVTVAVRPPVGGVAPLVPAGAVCDAVVVLDGDRLRLVDIGDEDRQVVQNLATAPLADLDLGDRGVVLATGAAAVEAFEVALDEWLTLTANAVVGLASAALDITCEYARERQAFGAAIGSFQGVSHPLADDATNLDGARLIARKAAWALGGADADRARELAAMAFAWACTAGEKATYDAIHVHGGYGFMLEYDVQLHYRRVRGWTRIWGDAEAAHRRVADARYPNARPSVAEEQ